MSLMVKLEPYEMDHAVLCGTKRRAASRDRPNTVTKEDMKTEEQWIENDVNGAAAEMVVAKALNRYWSGSVNTFKNGADVGESIQVRWSPKDHNSLIVRDNDPDDQWFFFVTGDLSRGMRIHGYIRGGEAKREEWREDRGGYGKPAFFVPHAALTMKGV
jgi:hypothetical protein